MSLKPLRTDHEGHYRYGVLGSLVPAIGTLIWCPELAALAVLLTGLIVGFGKEIIWDGLLGKGTPELSDALITVAAFVPVTVAVLIFQL